ncbi:MFS transporter [Aeromicrobium tamlense]|uniref:MFS family permease n=1 Tax=Aeromicrobium tamlense TaxID=375541 RepID=A0A8I0G086_9ACTN|nr:MULTISPECIES: MFS transporter [Aeromicrobium]MBD1271773.1 MFS transporter [Aeromicrobium tamlense]NYI39039.1 MFS family permease [Aeromicrobium tamlense]
MSPTFRSLSIRNYRVYAMGALVSNVGTWMQRVAQDWLILVLTGSGTALGITTGLQLLPALLFSPVAGVVADRFPKQQVLKCTQLAMAIPAAVLGMLAVTGTVEAWHVYVIAFVFGVGTAFDAPARQSFVAEMVGQEDLPNAVGLNSASFNTARMIGPALAGLLIAWLGSGAEATGWVILVNAASYLAVIASLSSLDTRRLRPSPVSGSRKGAVREGVRYVRSRPDLVLLLTCVFFVGTFGMNFQMTSALMATEVYGKGASEYGILGSVLAIGSLAGALLAARRTRPRLLFVVVAGMTFGIGEILAGLMPSYLTFALVLPLLGLSSLTMVTSANGLIQLTSTPQMRGRVAALYLMVFMGGTPLGAPLIGWIGEAFGARWTMIVGGALSALGVGVAAALYARTHHLSARGRVSPAVRRLLRRQRLDEEVLVAAD